jgi:hypothetical protein
VAQDVGTSGVPAYSGADGDGDGMIDQGDIGVWRAHFGQTLPAAGAGNGAGEAPSVEVQELRAVAPSTLSIATEQVGETIVQMPTETTSAPAETDAAIARAASFAVLKTRSVGQDSSSRSRRRINRYHVAESGEDDLPLLLAIDRIGRSAPQEWFVSDDSANNDRHADELESESLIDGPLVPALTIWQ